MKTTIFAALAMLSLGVGVASAQGVPAGGNFGPPQYGKSAFIRNNQSLFSWSNVDQNVGKLPADPSKTPRLAEQNATSTSSTARSD